MIPALHMSGLWRIDASDGQTDIYKKSLLKSMTVGRPRGHCGVLGPSDGAPSSYLATVRRSVVVNALPLQTKVAGGPSLCNTVSATVEVTLMSKPAHLIWTDLRLWCPVNLWNTCL